MAIIELDQAVDTPVFEFVRGAFCVRLGYARSKDAFATNLRGEDYLVTRVEGNRLAFALCDGVGSSFFGGLAAQILGEKIIQWLWDDETRSFLLSDPAVSVATEKIVATLNSETVRASNIMQQKDLSGLPNDLLRATYRGKLEKSGSQSNFVCGYIETDISDPAQGSLWLFWLGDARLRIWKDGQEKTEELDGRWLSEQSWSTKFGVAGQTFGYKAGLHDIDKIIAYTDGMLPYEQLIHPGTEMDVFARIFREQHTRSGSDDISFLDIQIAETVHSQQGDLVPLLRAIPAKSTEHIDGSETPTESIPISQQRKRRTSYTVVWALLAGALFFILGLAAGFFLEASHTISIFPSPTFSPTNTATSIPPTYTPSLTVTPIPTETLTPEPNITSPVQPEGAPTISSTPALIVTETPTQITPIVEGTTLTP